MCMSMFYIRMCVCLCFLELQFPSDANVYYAMDTNGTNNTFLVRKTSERTPKKILKSKSFS